MEGSSSSNGPRGWPFGLSCGCWHPLHSRYTAAPKHPPPPSRPRPPAPEWPFGRRRARNPRRSRGRRVPRWTAARHDDRACGSNHRNSTCSAMMTVVSLARSLRVRSVRFCCGSHYTAQPTNVGVQHLSTIHDDDVVSAAAALLSGGCLCVMGGCHSEGFCLRSVVTRAPTAPCIGVSCEL